TPYHQYSMPGNYNVCLTINGQGCENKNCQLIAIDQQQKDVTVEFKWINDSVTTKETFVNYSVGGLSYLWEFGDGATSTEFSPVHLYSNEGIYNVCLIAKGKTTSDTLCYDVKVQKITKTNCIADFNGYIDATNPYNYHFNNLSSVNTKSFWDFGDGEMSNDNNPVHTYKSAGVYDVALTVMSNDMTCQNKVVNTIAINISQSSCYAKFNYFYDKTNDQYKFMSGSSIGNIQKYYWNFDDGQNSVLANPIHKFAKPGSYNVKLTISDTVNNCQSDITRMIQVGSNICTADFNAFVDLNTDSVFFTDMSTGNVTNRYWYFGDGNFSNDQSPVHYYADKGEYEVSLTVSNNLGGESVITKKVEIGSNICSSEFTFVADNTTKKVNFSNTSKGEVSSYFWYFGDGQVSNEINPEHIYNKDGIYQVCLTVRNNLGGQSQVCHKVQIGQNICDAKFSYMVSASKDTVTFIDNSIGDISSWYWYFGDGNYSNVKNPKYHFLKDGIYTVCLTVRNTLGGQSQICQDIQIGDNILKADFTYLLNQNDSVYFTDKSTGNGTSWFWYFGDGTMSNVQNPVHSFIKDGIYNVSLTVMNDLGGISQIMKKVQKGDNVCNADFNALVKNDSVYFTDISMGNPLKWYWYFDDGTFSTLQNPSHKFTNGSHITFLSIFTKSGCQSQTFKTVEVGTKACEANFMYFIGTNDSVYFVDASKGDVNKWYWNFGDGSVSTLSNPVHKFNSQGNYNVTLSTIGTNGCNGTFKREIVISNGCIAVAEFGYFADATTKNVKFNNTSAGLSIDDTTKTKYFWSFGDGVFSNLREPAHIYTQADKYHVCLVVSDASGSCVKNYCDDIQVGQIECSAKFTTFIDTNMTVRFYNSSLGNSTNVYWQFGDATISSEKNPVHKYLHPGSYTVSLTTNSQGCMDFHSEEIVVGDLGKDCQANFIFNSDLATNGVQFIDQSIGKKITNYIWNFGDNSTNNISSQRNPQHTYSQGGFYNVCLTIVDTANKCYNMNCQDVKVGNTDVCKANFIFTIDSTNSTLKLTDVSVGNPLSWEWNFGDSTKSTLQNPSHKFSKPGYYLVTLKITTLKQCSSDWAELINMNMGNNGLQGMFQANVDTNHFKAKSYPVEFKGTAFGDPARCAWSFGDNSSQDSTTMAPVHTYYTTGNYNVCLTVSDPVTDQSNKYCKNVIIEDKVGIKHITISSSGIKLTNYPNPFSSNTSIVYSLPNSTNVDIAIYDIFGKKVQQLINEKQLSGEYSIRWNRDNISNGVYFLVLKTSDGTSITNKMVISR
ncbi:MAG: PKD domain-containing protein, partial [Bacteroidota bacterium]|nr:PKD domain-containing protein [Bacteroidota bacterium]